MYSKVNRELYGFLLSLFIMFIVTCVFFSVLINSNKETKYICFKNKSNLVLMTKKEMMKITEKHEDVLCKVIRINEKDFNFIRTNTILKD